MSEHSAARRFRILEILSNGGSGRDLGAFARDLQVDERTIRRDLDFLMGLLSQVHGIELRRGQVHAIREGFTTGYFGHEVRSRREAKQAIARAVVNQLDDNTALLLTAGSTTYYVAREIRRATVEERKPRNPMAFTNSLPALMELISGGISTGIVGEVYDPDDSAFHSHQPASAFHPSIAIVGASGLVARGSNLELFSHRGEEAAFMRQILSGVPEIWAAIDSTKIGRRHPWAFTDSKLLAGKLVRVFTDALDSAQRESLMELRAAAPGGGYSVTLHEAE
jgi:DeoR/GlpR family transcriptional regulator of sugar metabolism